VIYAEPSMGCDAVRDAWRSALDKAHRRYSLLGANGGFRFVLPDNRAEVSITLNWHTLQCDQVAVIALAK